VLSNKRGNNRQNTHNDSLLRSVWVLFMPHKLMVNADLRPQVGVHHQPVGFHQLNNHACPFIRTCGIVSPFLLRFANTR